MQLNTHILAQLEDFVQVIATGQAKPLRNFLQQMLFGIIASGSLVLAKIGRSLEEILLKYTEKRLCYQLNSRRWKIEALQAAYLKKVAHKITSRTVIAVDLTDLSKPYAQKMEGLSLVRDEDKDKLSPGYWILTMEAIRPDGKRIPLWLEAFSSKEEGFLSQNILIFEAINAVLHYVGKKGIWVFDRGFDDHKLMRFLERKRLNWIMRQRGDRHLLLGDQRVEMRKLAQKLPLPYRKEVEKRQGGKVKLVILHLGSYPVRIKEKGPRQWLIIISSLEAEERENGSRGKEEEAGAPIMLLTSLAAYGEGRSTKVLHYYLSRWGCEEGIRFLKEELDLEDLRALKLVGIKRLVWLAMLAYGLLCELALIEHFLGWILREAQAFGEALYIYYRVRQVVGRAFQAMLLLRSPP